MTVRSVLDIPIFHKVYELYKLLYSYHCRVPKSQRYTLWQKCENTTLLLLEALIGVVLDKLPPTLNSNWKLSNDVIILSLCLLDG